MLGVRGRDADYRACRRSDAVVCAKHRGAQPANFLYAMRFFVGLEHWQSLATSNVVARRPRAGQHPLEHVVFKNKAVEQRGADMQASQCAQHPCEDAVQIPRLLAKS